MKISLNVQAIAFMMMAKTGFAGELIDSLIVYGRQAKGNIAHYEKGFRVIPDNTTPQPV